jgi:hypothetical protein
MYVGEQPEPVAGIRTTASPLIPAQNRPFVSSAGWVTGRSTARPAEVTQVFDFAVTGLSHIQPRVQVTVFFSRAFLEDLLAVPGP